MFGANDTNTGLLWNGRGGGGSLGEKNWPPLLVFYKERRNSEDKLFTPTSSTGFFKPLQRADHGMLSGLLRTGPFLGTELVSILY